MASEGEAPVPVREEGQPATGAPRNGAHSALQHSNYCGTVFGKFVASAGAADRGAKLYMT